MSSDFSCVQSHYIQFISRLVDSIAVSICQLFGRRLLQHGVITSTYVVASVRQYIGVAVVVKYARAATQNEDQSAFYMAYTVLLRSQPTTALRNT